jgi:type I restriction enzyme S subunit
MKKIFARMEIEPTEKQEQREIVRRGEALFKNADQIEERYNKARAHVDKLTQSLLAKALRGELAPRYPNEEPASELLQRIRAEREKRKAEGKPPKRRKKSRPHINVPETGTNYLTLFREHIKLCASYPGKH